MITRGVACCERHRTDSSGNGLCQYHRNDSVIGSTLQRFHRRVLKLGR